MANQIRELTCILALIGQMSLTSRSRSMREMKRLPVNMSAYNNINTLHSPFKMSNLKFKRFLSSALLIVVFTNTISCGIQKSETNSNVNDPEVPGIRSDNLKGTSADDFSESRTVLNSGDQTESQTPFVQKHDEFVDDGRMDGDVHYAYVTEKYINPNEDPTIIVQKPDFFSFTATDIFGESVSFARFKGKVVLVVNVASECGFTDGHYKALAKLQHKYEKDGFTVLAFPCNQFGAQEPGDSPDIENFVRTNYGVHFPLFAKINVLDEDVPDVWKFLIDQAGEAPNWNFWKYLIDRTGHVVGAWGPWISVEEMTHYVEDAVYSDEHINLHADSGYDPTHGGEL